MHRFVVTMSTCHGWPLSPGPWRGASSDAAAANGGGGVPPSCQLQMSFIRKQSLRSGLACNTGFVYYRPAAKGPSPLFWTSRDRPAEQSRHRGMRPRLCISVLFGPIPAPVSVEGLAFHESDHWEAALYEVRIRK